PERSDQERGRPAQGQSQADGQEHRGIDGRQHLPLRHLCPYPRSHQDGGTTMRRRAFVIASATAAGGVLVSLYLDRPLRAQQVPAQNPKIYPPDAFIEIRPDGKIVSQVNRLEFWLGVLTAWPMLLADW